MATWTGTQFVISQGSGSTITTTASGDFLLKANNLSDVPNQDTARNNLGINISATPPVAPQVNDIWIDTDEDAPLWSTVGGMKWSDLG